MKKSTLLISFFITFQLEAQIRFSQFYSSPLLFNPANTGRFNKSMRLGGGYRSEKNSAGLYNQSFISFDSKILSSIIPQNDCFALGLIALNERSLADGIKNDYISVSLAYQKGLDEEGEQQIGVGFQTTLGHKRIVPQVYFYESQLNAWIHSGFTNIDMFRMTGVDVSYFDLNTGIIYQGKINAKNYFSISGTLHHANRPNKTFTGGALVLNRQLGGHIAWENRPSEKENIYSYFIISFLRENQTFAGGIIYRSDIRTKHYQASLGMGFKKNILQGNFLVPMGGLKFKELQLNLSYDINISKKTIQQAGASEITLTYTGAKTRSGYLENKFIRY